MNIGEVYFIGERDRSTGKLTENVKIGMVGAKGDSGERLKQHQTGNPRDLVLHHVVETPAPFWVENGLHQRLNGLRVRAEWHKLDPKGLEDAIQCPSNIHRIDFCKKFGSALYVDQNSLSATCDSWKTIEQLHTN